MTDHDSAATDPTASDRLWSSMLAIAAARRAGEEAGSPAGLSVDADGRWRLAGDWPAAERPALEALLTLYAPLLALPARRRFVVGHLGQSLDGRIATGCGDSRYVNGPQNLTHLHRLRALCDAVIVGALTVSADDPQLTTRHVPGPHPVRVVIDPSARIDASHRVCHDRQSTTLIARRTPVDPQASCGSARLLSVDQVDGQLDLGGLLDQLADLGLHAVLVEGGGITVSRFLSAGLLDRLQLAIAPLIIGSGRQGIQLPGIERLCDGLRPTATIHPMGVDMLWDLTLEPARPGPPSDGAGREREQVQVTDVH